MKDGKYWNIDIECMSQQDIRRLQLEKLREIISYASMNSSFYRNKFEKLNVSVEDLNSLSDISKFPFIDKQDIRLDQEKEGFLGNMVAVSEEEIVYIASSSGSTGVSTISPFNKHDIDIMNDCSSRAFWQTGVREKDRYIHLLNFSLFISGMGPFGPMNLGATTIFGGTLPSDRLLYIMEKFQPTVMGTSPSYAWQLGNKAKELGIDPKTDLNIRRIITGGEIGGSNSATRKEIEDLWGAKVYDFYGMSDIFPPFASECINQNGLHLMEDQVFTEVVDPISNVQLPDGEIGELVFTALTKTARPMIRFKSGDLGYICNEPCSCGNTHRRIYIKGRVDNMIIVSGVNVFPSDIETAMKSINGTTGEYVVHIFEKDKTTKFSIDVEKKEDTLLSDLELKELVKNEIKKIIGVKPETISVFKEKELQNNNINKTNRFIDERCK